MVDTERAAVVVGAGHAGGTFATLLRQNGWTGPVVVLGEEPHPPYQRPPLSKAWLKGEVAPDGLLLRLPSHYAEQGIDLRLNVRAQRIDRDRSLIRLVDGGEIPYGILVLATGVQPRRLPVPGAGLSGVFVLRTMADADALRSAMAPGRRIVIVGGGYIGLEVAAAARACGLDVTVVEREDRVLSRVASPEIADFFTGLHQRHGVSFVFGASVEVVEGVDGRAAAVRLSDGRRLAADLVLSGIGAVPDCALAEQAGIACCHGISVDADGRTSDPAIFAIGDVTHRPLPRGLGAGRLESVQSALEQARRLALLLCGKPRPPDEVPWFWSDQYDVKLQIAGLAAGASRKVLRGTPADGKFAVFHVSEAGVLLAVEAASLPAEFMAGRQWIGQSRVPSVERLADVSRPIRDAA